MSPFNEEIDLRPDDDFSLLLSEGLMANIDFQGNPAATTSKPCSTIEIYASALVPISNDDESISAQRTVREPPTSHH